MRTRSFPVRRRAFVLSPLVLLLAGTLLAPATFARPTIRRAFFNVYTSAVGSRLDNLPSHATHCGVCHLDFNGGGPKNPYGNAVLAAGANEAGIQSIQNQDADGDGYTNLTEITDLTNYSNTPTFPGLTSGNVGGTSNVPVLSEITPYLVPLPAGDVQPPSVTVTAPNGGESWVGSTVHTVTWLATDNVGVVSVDLYYRDGATAPWAQIGANLTNNGSFSWFVHNTPTTASKVRVVARDAASNVGADTSNANFTIVRQPGGKVATTLRDFDQPGTQPFGGGYFQDHTSCYGCHGGYDPAVEPGDNFKGMMMGQAARDPLFFACLAVAEQDAPSSGDLCLRCHTPFGWMSGRSQPTSGLQLNALDRDGVACDFCHRAVDPVYKPGVSPAADLAVINGLLPAHTPTGYSNGQYVVDPAQTKRGPFTDAIAPHPFVASPFHRSSDLCGTCHDVSNPVFLRVSGADYAPGPLDQKADSISSLTLMPLERTYSEWKNSSYPAGVYAPEFAGNKPDGIVASCQDCHVRAVSGKGCNDPAAPLRADLPLHDMMGGNAWMPGVVASLYSGETNASALAGGAARAVSMLQKAAVVDVAATPEGDSTRADVTVTNRTGHKLPTGYPEGRRMWLHVVARDGAGGIVYESGAWDPISGQLDASPAPVVYEAHLGVSPALGNVIGVVSGPTFHFALNDTLHKDNRIPPLGFTNAAFATFGGGPVDPEHPGQRYADGQNWDVADFALPRSARSVKAELLYQTTSKEYVEFLRDENTTNGAGQTLYDAWVAHGRSAPVAMAADSATFSPLGVPEGPRGGEIVLSVAGNPFRGALEVRLDLVRPMRVSYEVYDVRGRRMAHREQGLLGAGPNRLSWDGTDAAGRDAGAGIFWVRVSADEQLLVRQVVRLR
jgi:hypothetical protein